MNKTISQSKRTSNSTTSRTNRPNPMIPKAGVTHSGRRTYSSGGKVCK